MSRKHTILAVLVVLLLAGFYAHGTFDRLLSPIGLNFHRCARNGLGATFCGQELETYESRVQVVKEQLKTSETQTREAQQTRETEAASARETEKLSELRSLKAKLAREKAIYEREPEGSVASDLAKDEYEYARAQLQQLAIHGG